MISKDLTKQETDEAYLNSTKICEIIASHPGNQCTVAEIRLAMKVGVNQFDDALFELYANDWVEIRYVSHHKVQDMDKIMRGTNTVTLTEKTLRYHMDNGNWG